MVYFQDEVFVRTSDLQDVSAIFGADLYCHKNCIRSYLNKYHRAVQEKSDTSENVSPKTIAFQQVVNQIDPHL